ncbi:MAG: phosphatase PAP2 family protein, partial [Candidatus Marinimicrobia bacterium]|nr:phosphatase PAP2 family protein [Candidatus Neomarinimicrobiota bacterium]
LNIKTDLYRFDKVLLAFSLLMFVAHFLNVTNGYHYLLAALGNLFIFLMIYRITYRPPLTGIGAHLRWLYPLLLLVPLQYQVELAATIFHGGAVYDPLVRSWDKALFGPYVHRWLPDVLAGAVWREGFHLLYIAYYPLIAGSYMFVWNRGRAQQTNLSEGPDPRFLRFAFVMLASFASYLIVYILFPVIGPLDDRFLRFHGVGLVGPIIDWLYAHAHSSGGAFPSSHVGEAVVIVLLLRPRGYWRLAFWLFIGGMTIATIYGSFHYAIDALAGLLSGGALYLLWSWLYHQWGPETGTNDPAESA